jgi:AraC-like DNA-binding protein/quercetin dioxygenase-like cupin family protein
MKRRKQDKKNDLTYEKNQFPNGYAYSIYFFEEIESFPLHWHHYIEIIYAQYDGVIYEVNGEEICMKGGDILFIWPGELHSIVYMSEPEHTLMLQFDAQILTNHIDFRKVAYLFYSTRLLEAEKETTLVQSLIEKMLAMWRSSNEDSFMTEIKVCMKIYEFIIYLGEGRKITDGSKTKQLTMHKNKVDQQLFNVCNYLTTHCTESIKLEEAASIVGFSKYHFSKVFREYTGLGFTEFMVRERLRIAEALLKERTLSITEVSFEAGFNSISSFNRVFLQFKRVSPTQFRKMYQI